MTWLAQIEASGDLFMRDVVRLRMGNRYPDGSFDVVSGVTDSGDLVLTRGEPDTHVEALGIALPSHALHAILAALSRHLGAVEHPEQLRKDYEAERARVDRLIGAVIDPVALPAQGDKR